MVSILLAFISMVGMEIGAFSMCEIDSVLRLAGFMEHQLPEFPFPLTLEWKNKKLNCPLTDQIPVPLYSNTWPWGQEATELGLITSTAHSSVAGISVPAAKTTQSAHWGPPQINWSSQSEPHHCF